jgi:glucose/arabinose dehydrogenase
MNRQTVASLLCAGALAAPLPALAQEAPVAQGPKNAGFDPAFPQQTRAPERASGVKLEVEELARGLVHPWGIAVLPGGGYLVTERPGRLRVIGADGTVSDPVAGLPEVLAEKQGGLLDVALGPDFATERWVYWTYAKPVGADKSATAAARGRLSEDLSEVTEVTDIFVQSPPSPSPMHYGSRLVFDGEGHVFITTGEHFTQAERVHAQDLAKTYGKVIRVTTEGAVPLDNPFRGQSGVIDTIWSYGHRNIQGAAMGPGGLWTVEHGPKGGDELNRPEPGRNYGWPRVSYGVQYDGKPVGTGEARGAGIEEPVYYWDPVIAPGGMAFYEGAMFADWQGDILIGSMVPGGIVRLEHDGGRITGEERLLTDRGRIRDVEVAPDGAILALVDAEDGALLRLTPAK